MGYTRYWDRTNKPLTNKFLNGVKDILNDCKLKGITICGWNGTNDPVITSDTVSLNGKGELGHETFLINENIGFSFCKTARKPYDYAVREILKIAEEEGIVENVSSDGENNRIISDDEYNNSSKRKT